jgi:flagellar motor protein MotB
MTLEAKVSISTAIFAVLLSLNSIFGGNADNNAIIAQAETTNLWAYFQSKSTKQGIQEAQLRQLELDKIKEAHKGDAAYLQKLDSTLAYTRQQIERYEKEKNEIKQQAEAKQTEANAQNQSGDVYDLAEGFYQVSLVLGALVLVAQLEKLWVFSVLFGLGGSAITVLNYLGFL